MLLAFRTERDKEKGASQGRLPEPEAKQCTNKCQPIQILLCAPRASVIRMDFLDLTIADSKTCMTGYDFSKRFALRSSAVIPSIAMDPGHRAKKGLTGDSCQPLLSIIKSSEPETKLQYRGVENPYALMRRRIDIEAARSHLDDVIAV